MSFRFDRALELLESAREKDRLSHAYLITGPAGSGKRRLAIRLVEMVNPVQPGKEATSLGKLRSATTALVEPESKSRQIKVDAIRAVEHTLQMAAPPGITKYAIINEAERMGEAAENAFLKTLEEPPRASRLILISERPEQLLDTILSRCIRLDLAGENGAMPVSEAAQDLLSKLSEHALEGREGISGALGLMSAFSAILKDEKAAIAARHKADLKAESEIYRNATEGDYLKQREDYYEALTQSEYLRERNRLIEYLVAWYGDAMRQKSGSSFLDLPDFSEGTERLAQSKSIDELGRRIDAVEKLRSDLNTTVLEGLALEAGFIRAFA